MTAHEIIIRPIVSERSFSGMELNKYTFEVAKDANKYQIKDAVEEIFGVKVVRACAMSPARPVLGRRPSSRWPRATPSRSLATRPKTRCC